MVGGLFRFGGRRGCAGPPVPLFPSPPNVCILNVPNFAIFPGAETACVMDNTTIVIRGAREHNLRNVSLDLPRNNLIVFTGVSGSGKSSLAFDTLYAEGQRRYVESLSSYARQF